jgi:hypothetical protein
MTAAWPRVVSPEPQPGPHRHKWLGAPKGAGFLYVRRELQRDVHLLLISWGYEGDDPSFVSRHEKQGTRDPSAYLTVPAAIAWQDEHEWAAVRDRCHELARRARNELDLESLTPDSDEFFAQMVTLRLPKNAPKGSAKAALRRASNRDPSARTRRRAVHPCVFPGLQRHRRSRATQDRSLRTARSIVEDTSPPRRAFARCGRVRSPPAQSHSSHHDAEGAGLECADSNALGVRVRMLEDVEGLFRGSRNLEAEAGAAVLDRNGQRVCDAAPQERDLDAVRRAVMKLCECRIGHVLTVAVGESSRHRGHRCLWVRSTPVLTGG